MPWSFHFSYNKFSINLNVETFNLVSSIDCLKIKPEIIAMTVTQHFRYSKN